MDVRGLGCPGGPGSHSNIWGDEAPTFWHGFPAAPPKIDDSMPAHSNQVLTNPRVHRCETVGSRVHGVHPLSSHTVAQDEQIAWHDKLRMMTPEELVEVQKEPPGENSNVPPFGFGSKYEELTVPHMCTVK